MPSITLPDGSKKDFEQSISIDDLAKSIGPGLARSAIAGKINETLYDLSYVIEKDCSVSIITKETSEGLDIIRHSTAHLMAHAVKLLYPKVEITIGPVIENGFYYDFAIGTPFTDQNLESIENKMHEIAKQNLSISKEVWTKDQALKYFKKNNEHYKVEIIKDIADEDDLSVYKQGDWLDLCKGPHVPSTKFIDSFKLTKVAGAYWRGDSSNEMLQRIYGTAWSDKKSLKQYLAQLKEAEKRDHRRIGKDLDLFSIQEEAGGGLVFWHPNGSRIRHVIEDYWRQKHLEANYELLHTPHIALDTLWQTSGHTDFYQELMFKPIEDENQLYRLKPMNCPFHVLIYKNQLRSYRDLPIKWAELGTVYRYERGGTLHGMLRVRGLTQDDAHIFCRPDQIEDEINEVLDLTFDLLNAFGFEEFTFNLSTRPEKAVGSNQQWDLAEDSLKKTLEDRGLDYEIDEAGGAFYGPKIDVNIRDAVGRPWQCTTIQFDFNLPERFGLSYIGEDGEEHQPYMVHRVIFGSLERFMGILIEHFGGAFPVWLAPVQVKIIPIADRHLEYAGNVSEHLTNAGIRVEVDDGNDRMNAKIRQAQLQKVPYMFVVGDREVESDSVSVRIRSGENLGTVSATDITARILGEVSSRS